MTENGKSVISSYSDRIRVDLQLVADQVAAGSRVLDVGCGDGTLLAHLRDFKQVDGRGLEMSMARVSAAVRHGLAGVDDEVADDLFDPELVAGDQGGVARLDSEV